MRCFFEDPVERDGQWIYRCANCRVRLALTNYCVPSQVYRDCKPKPGKTAFRPIPAPPCVNYQVRIDKAIEQARNDPTQLPRNALGVASCILICEKCPENQWSPSILCKVINCAFVTKTTWQYGHCPRGHW